MIPCYTVEKVLADGRADYILMARSLAADPNWANKAVRDSFYGTAYDVVPVGDCVKLGNLVGSVRTGFDAGLRL